MYKNSRREHPHLVKAEALLSSRIRGLFADNPDTTFDADDVAILLDVPNVQNVRTALTRLFQDGNALCVAEGLYRNKTEPPQQPPTPLEKLVLDHLADYPDLRKFEIAAALGRGRGVINRAVTSLVEKGHLRGQNGRFRLLDASSSIPQSGDGVFGLATGLARLIDTPSSLDFPE
ncbi:hypothetical protein ACVIGB_000760 [Bradyrhizobium sp. USDA 4341]